MEKLHSGRLTGWRSPKVGKETGRINEIVRPSEGIDVPTKHRGARGLKLSLEEAADWRRRGGTNRPQRIFCGLGRGKLPAEGGACSEVMFTRSSLIVGK